VQGSGLVEGMPTGIHVDRSICDDVVTKDSVTNKEMLLKTEEGFRLSLNLTSRKNQRRVIGTIYSYDDLFSTYFSNNPTYRVRKYSIYDCNLFTKDQIAQLRIDMGPVVFANQMELEPADPTELIFAYNKINIEPFQLKDIKKDIKKIIILCDPALSDSKRADDCSIQTNVITNQKHIYTEHLSSFKTKNPTEIAHEIVNHVKRIYVQGLRVNKIKIETVAFQRALMEITRKALQDAGLWPITMEEFNSKQSKNERILGVEPFVSMGMLHMKPDHIELYDQIRKYPKVAHDDHIDCLSMVVPEVGHLTPQDAKSPLTNNFKRDIKKPNKYLRTQLNVNRRAEERAGSPQWYMKRYGTH